MATERHALASRPGNDRGSPAAATESLPVIFGIDVLERRVALRAEQRLLIAVLQEAVSTFQRYVDAGDRRGRRLFGEVERWFDSNDATWAYAFVPLCDALGFDPGYLRSGMRRWREAQRPSRPNLYPLMSALRGAS